MSGEAGIRQRRGAPPFVEAARSKAKQLTVAARARAECAPSGTPLVSGPSAFDPFDSLPSLRAGSGLDPRGLIALLTAVLRTHVRRPWKGGLHTENCRRGQGVDGYGGLDGAPCSQGCATAQVAITLGLGWLSQEYAG